MPVVPAAPAPSREKEEEEEYTATVRAGRLLDDDDDETTLRHTVIKSRTHRAAPVHHGRGLAAAAAQDHPCTILHYLTRGQGLYN